MYCNTTSKGTFFDDTRSSSTECVHNISLFLKKLIYELVYFFDESSTLEFKGIPLTKLNE